MEWEKVAELYLPIKPISLNNMYFTDPSGHRRLSYKVRDYKDEIGWSIKAKGFIEPMKSLARIDVEFTVADKRRRDLDNLLKGLLDATTGIFVEDDSQYVEINAKKLLGTEFGMKITLYRQGGTQE